MMNTSRSLQIDCQDCRTLDSMIATEIPRFSEIVRVMSFILLIPSFGLGFTVLTINYKKEKANEITKLKI
jgi:hypothetical protein